MFGSIAAPQAPQPVIHSMVVDHLSAAQSDHEAVLLGDVMIYAVYWGKIEDLGIFPGLSCEDCQEQSQNSPNQPVGR